jgi:hypothetical protein
VGRSFSLCNTFFAGGAERLMVNLALAMQDLGHEVKIFTSHHDPQRCFQETKLDGSLVYFLFLSTVQENWAKPLRCMAIGSRGKYLESLLPSVQS